MLLGTLARGSCSGGLPELNLNDITPHPFLCPCLNCRTWLSTLSEHTCSMPKGGPHVVIHALNVVLNHPVMSALPPPQKLSPECLHFHTSEVIKGGGEVPRLHAGWGRLIGSIPDRAALCVKRAVTASRPPCHHCYI